MPPVPDDRRTAERQRGGCRHVQGGDRRRPLGSRGRPLGGEPSDARLLPTERLGVMLRGMTMTQRPTAPLAAVAVLLAAVASGCTSGDAAKSPMTAPTSAKVSVERTPYAVPTSPASGVTVRFGPSRIRNGDQKLSVPWKLVRLPDGGRTLIVHWYPGCDRPSPGGVRFEETMTSVLVQAVTADETYEACGRAAIAALDLKQPLGTRALLHAPTQGQLDEIPPRAAVAEEFDRRIEGHGESWFRDGREVGRPEITVTSGPSHCGWESAHFLIGSALSTQSFWVRDPAGALEHLPRAKNDFRRRAVLPVDARPTGYERGSIQIWTAPSDRGQYVYLVHRDHRDDAERWVKGQSLCA